jgi:hypothetical protein
MISAKEGRNSTDTPKSPGASKEGFIQDTFEVSITHHRVRKGWPNLRASQGSNIQALNINPRIAHFVHLLREEEGETEVLVADSVHPQENHSTCFVARTKATPQEHVIIPSTSRKSLLCQPHNLHSKKRCSVHPHTVHPTSSNMSSPSCRNKDQVCLRPQMPQVTQR